MDTTTIDLPTHLNGPGLVAWIEEEEDGEVTYLDVRLDSHASNYRYWRRGGQASAAVADVVLMKLGLHLGMVPEHLYEQRSGPDPNSEEAHAEIRRRFDAKEAIGDIARALGLDHKTVRRHIGLTATA